MCRDTQRKTSNSRSRESTQGQMPGKCPGFVGGSERVRWLLLQTLSLRDLGELPSFPAIWFVCFLWHLQNTNAHTYFIEVLPPSFPTGTSPIPSLSTYLPSLSMDKLFYTLCLRSSAFQVLIWEHFLVTAIRKHRQDQTLGNGWINHHTSPQLNIMQLLNRCLWNGNL